MRALRRVLYSLIAIHLAMRMEHSHKKQRNLRTKGDWLAPRAPMTTRYFSDGRLTLSPGQVGTCVCVGLRSPKAAAMTWCYS